MRDRVPCFGQLRLHSFATGASLGFLLACGSSGGGGLFSANGGAASNNAGSPSTGGAPLVSGTGGNATSSGGSATPSGGGSANGGTSTSGGSSTGGSASAGEAVTSGGATAGGAASGGARPGGASSGGASSGGAAPTTGGQNGGQAGAPSSGGVSAGGLPGAAGVGGDSGGSGGGGCSAGAVERCDGVDNDCDAMIDEKACATNCTGFALGDHGYMVCDVEVNANKASALCEEEGLRLAWIESADENAALLQSIEEIGSSGKGGGILEVSIGATDVEKEGSWHWRGGSDFWQGGGKGSPVDGAYANWGSGRPNNSVVDVVAGEDCAVLVIDQRGDDAPGQWNDVECTLGYGVLCEEP